MKAQVAADYKKLSDEELVHRLVHRQEQYPIHILFERYGHLVFGVCARYQQNSQKARQTTQQIFIQLLDELKHVGDDRFRPWLLKFTRSFCAAAQYNDETVADIAELQFEINDDHSYRRLEKAISGLDGEEKQYMEWFYIDRMTHSEISNKTDNSQAKVKSLIQTGKRNICMQLELSEEERK